MYLHGHETFTFGYNYIVCTTDIVNVQHSKTWWDENIIKMTVHGPPYLKIIITLNWVMYQYLYINWNKTRQIWYMAISHVNSEIWTYIETFKHYGISLYHNISPRFRKILITFYGQVNMDVASSNSNTPCSTKFSIILFFHILTNSCSTAWMRSDLAYQPPQGSCHCGNANLIWNFT